MQQLKIALLAGLTLAGLAVACGGDKQVSAADPGATTGGSSGAAGSAGAGPCPTAGAAGASGSSPGIKVNESSCEAGKYIFLTTLDNRLVRFDPTTLAISVVTDLNCKPDEIGAVPVAFAVDKQSVAWINYSDGTLHKLDMTKLSCEKTAYVPYQQGWQKFAMTFNNDPQDPTGESILAADLTLNDSKVDNDVNGLGKISTGDLSLKLIGDYDGPFARQRALVTGRRDGRVFAYFIDNDLPRRIIAEIDPASAKVLSQTPVPTTQTIYGSFAHWGGSYYHFYSSDQFTNSAIARYTPGKGMKIIVKDAGLILYGASVSTCAPTQVDIK